jgi:hypothetical protein
MKHLAHESRKRQIAILQEVACAYAVRIYCLLRLLGQLAVRKRCEEKVCACQQKTLASVVGNTGSPQEGS